MIEAARFMQDPKNADTVAEAAAPTGHNKEVNKAALKAVPRHRLLGGEGRRHAAQQDRGGRRADEEDRRIKPDKEPVTYDDSSTRSVWNDANAMVK